MIEGLFDEAIVRARAKFVAMAATFSLGVFNDNFYKQAVLLLAVGAGRPDMQGYALAIYSLPFILCAAPVGWLADRFSKRTVVIGTKGLELVAMLAGAVGICTGHVWLIFTMLGLMGLQSACFSPALNGSIPELYPAGYVPRANAVLRIFVTLAILSGMATAGFALDRTGTGWLGLARGHITVALIVITVAVVGLLVSFGVARRPAAAPQAKFPWTGPADSIRQLLETRADPLLAITIGASVFIWFIGSLQILLINPLGLLQFRLGNAATSALLVAELTGMAMGGVLGSRLATGPRWYRPVIAAGIVFSLLMIMLTAVPVLPAILQHTALFLLIAGTGAAGGVFLIPVESFIQVRAAPERKGAVLAAANFVVFIGILLSGFLANMLNAAWRPTISFGIAGTLSLLMVGWLFLKYRRADRGPSAVG
ncbi:MAG: MFS transporter [Verrucomicrobia bacterium]|nr:MFS transporter [Verrucomicrobiota bacterium]MBU1734422.1 MFS transporter [Verrucomicrobiota bacterium]MBU1857328.1 MFS transporter [Verrucomicrobiota bacterium]